MTRKPDFTNILKVLRREAPARATLFELFLNWPLYEYFAGRKFCGSGLLDVNNFLIQAFQAAGYDYATVSGSDFSFKLGKKTKLSTHSQNENALIPDREALSSFAWQDPDDFDYSNLSRVTLPDGMKLMVLGPCGVLENTVELVGYENLCMQIYDAPDFVAEVVDNIGSRLHKYYKNCLAHENVGIVMVNDDWGFKTQPLLSPSQMREFIFPWHRKIVALAHEANVPAVLHSCGNLEAVMDDVIDDIRFNGKHSFEDAILPVEDAYERYGGRIAILGGIDLDFLIKKSETEIRERSLRLLAMGEKGYALGTGNSVPEYVPREKYLAMRDVVYE